MNVIFPEFEAARAPSPRVGEGWGEGALDWITNTALRSTTTLSLALSPQGRGDKARYAEGYVWVQ